MYAASSTFLGYLGGVVVLANSMFPVPFCFRVTGRERLHFDISGISSIILTLSLGSALKKKKRQLNGSIVTNFVSYFRFPWHCISLI